MRQYARGQIAGAQEQEGGVEAEETGVGELEEGAQDGGEERRVRMDQLELVEVVDMGDSEVERGDEDELGERQAGEDVEGDDKGAED